MEVKRPGRLAYRTLLRKQINLQGDVIVEDEKSNSLRGKLKFGYFSNDNKFYELSKYDIKKLGLGGKPGYFVVGDKDFVQIPLCKIERYDFSRLQRAGVDLLELKVNNSLPSKKQRKHLRQNN